MGKDFSSLSKEEKKQVQRYNYLKSIADQLDRRINEGVTQIFPTHMYEELKQFIDENKYNVSFDGNFYSLTK